MQCVDRFKKVKVHHDEATNCAAPPAKMMASFTGVVLFTVTACALLRSIAPESFLQGTQESASGSGSGDDQQALAPQVRKLHILCKSSQFIDNDVSELPDAVCIRGKRSTSVRRQ